MAKVRSSRMLFIARMISDALKTIVELLQFFKHLQFYNGMFSNSSKSFIFSLYLRKLKNNYINIYREWEFTKITAALYFKMFANN